MEPFNFASSPRSLLIILLSPLLTSTIPTSRPVKCYKCISFACDSRLPPELCYSAGSYVQSSLKLYYHTETSEIPTCPPVGDEIGWETLKQDEPSSSYCLYECMLGRFQVTSSVVSSQDKTFSYGTVLGCGTKHLKNRIFLARQERKRLDFCHLENVTSVVSNDGTEHALHLEQCTRTGDLCKSHDYCINPTRSIVLPFVVEQEESKVDVHRFVFWVIGIVSVVGFIVLIASFAGIKYG